MNKIFFFAIVLITSIASSQQDSIKLNNGNIMVGEIRSLSQGVLTLKTPYSYKDFEIKWFRVTEIYSNRYFITTLGDGTRISGTTINSISGSPGKVQLDTGLKSFEQSLMSIIFLDPIGKNYLSRLDFMVDIGLTLAKSNNYKQYTTSFTGNYNANKWGSSIYFNTVLSRQDDTEDLRRVEGDADFVFYLPHDWFVQAQAEYLGNDEQKLKLRSAYKVGPGYFFNRSNDKYMAVGGGIAYIFETYIDDTPSKSSSEIYAGVSTKKYDTADFSYAADLVYYYSLTETSRYRVDLGGNIKYKLPYDMYVKASLTYNYDSKPAENASKSDYITQLAFGWKFRGQFEK